jgi:glycosyltransferase involved in cell wall biosynthesis
LLGPRHRVTLLCLTRGNVPESARREVASFCERVVTLPLGPGPVARGLLRGVVSDLPLQVAVHVTSAMQRTIRDALRRDAYDLVHAQLVRMAPYVEENLGVPRVLDLIDALSLNMSRRQLHDRGFSRWAARLESTRLTRYERRVCRIVDRAVVSSRVDSQAIGSFPNLATVTNGVDLREFPFVRDGREPRVVVCSGNMGYFPNRDGVTWFARSILPLIRRALPDTRFLVVGARPARAIRRLARADPRLTVSGFVERVHPHLAQAGLAVAPIRTGSGQQLKVLEALASGTPVVATSLAVSGLDASHDEHLLVADAPESFAHHAVRLLTDPGLAHRLALNGRRLVEERYTWERSVAELENVYRAAAREGTAEPPR